MITGALPRSEPLPIVVMAYASIHAAGVRQSVPASAPIKTVVDRIARREGIKRPIRGKTGSVFYEKNGTWHDHLVERGLSVDRFIDPLP